MNAGDTFLAPGFDDHLWMVISDPSLDAEQVVVVCFLTAQDHYDQSCIVRSGEHPFVKHDTCVNYPAAKVTSDSKLNEHVAKGTLRLKTPLSQNLLERIRQLAAESDMPSGAYDVLRQQGFVP